MRLIILGAGGLGQVIGDLALQDHRFDEVIYLDDKESDITSGICSEFSSYKDDRTEFYPAFGNNELRKSWIEKLEKNKCSLLTLVHHAAYVSPTCTLGAGTVIMPNAVVNTNTVVKEGCIINIGALVDHDCILEESVHVAPGAIVKGMNHLPECMKVESGKVIQRNSL